MPHNESKMKIDRIPSKSRVVFNVSVRNAADRIQRCLESVEQQTCDNWVCIVSDDASKDGTSKIIENVTKNKPRYTAIFNRTRKWKMETFSNAVRLCQPHDIIVELDGDDELCNPSFVAEISDLHTKYDTVWTQHRINDSFNPDWHHWNSTPLPDSWSRSVPYRETLFSPKMYPGHLRTFKKKYFDRIKPEDLLFNREPLQVTSDVAYYTPIIEMTHPSFRYFFDKECAIYNIVEGNDTLAERKSKGKDNTELNGLQFQSNIGLYIKSLPPYLPIPMIHKIFFIPNENLEEWYKTAERIALLEPFSKIHLFALGEYSSEKLLSQVRVPNMYLYNLDYIVNNSLSLVRNVLQQQTELTTDNIRYLYYFCMKYIATHFHHDRILLLPFDKMRWMQNKHTITEDLLRKYDQEYSVSLAVSTVEDMKHINQNVLENLVLLKQKSN